MQKTILIVFGTRPEAIKLFPVVRALSAMQGIRVITCVTGQHRGLLDQVLSISGMTPDIDLDLMAPNQSLDQLTARLLCGIGSAIDIHGPDRIIVQGDTASAMAGALAAYYRKVPVGHVEAGLRSGDKYHPWPEEVNRRIISTIADLHFAPTEHAASALRAEGVANGVHTTGNTVIDALKATEAAIEARPMLAEQFEAVRPQIGGRKLVLVTTHRRENFGEGMERIAHALNEISRRQDVAVLLPVHPNPGVTNVLNAALPSDSRVLRIPPLDYPSFVLALRSSYLVLTDSGGVQEEAPAFGKPVLVMRETTERPEGIAAGTAKLVGTDTARIVREVHRLIDDTVEYERMAKAHSPYGDGQAATKIARILCESTAGRPS